MWYGAETGVPALITGSLRHGGDRQEELYTTRTHDFLEEKNKTLQTVVRMAVVKTVCVETDRRKASLLRAFLFLAKKKKKSDSLICVMT